MGAKYLNRNVTEAHLREIFGTYGTLQKVELLVDAKVKISKGKANVQFQNVNDAEQAVICMDGGQIDGNIVNVTFVLVEKRRRSPSPKKSGIRLLFILLFYF